MIKIKVIQYQKIRNCQSRQDGPSPDFHTIRKILDTEKGPFYFIDLHTTSSETQPFLTVKDSLLNRKFTMQYPVPMILGIEEYLEGPLLSYINELGYVAFGFEGGQHDAPAAIENIVSFIYLTMFFVGNMDKAAINYDQHYEFLAKASPDSHEVYEIYSRYEIRSGEMFSMEPGFINFQQIYKGQKLAVSNGKAVNTCRSGKIFMPLYQRQGHDGFLPFAGYIHFSCGCLQYYAKYVSIEYFIYCLVCVGLRINKIP